MKILHTGDIHLGAVLSHRFPPEKAKKLRSEMLSCFADMLSYAKGNGFSAVLVCGDLSDAGELPYSTQSYLLKTIADAAPVKVFYVAGNHDPVCFSGGKCAELPENFHIFSKAWETVSLGEGVFLTSRILPENPEASDFPTLSADVCNLVMLHGALTDGSFLGGANAEIPVRLLAGGHIDYLALGHYHAYRTGRLDRRGIFCYAGCPMGHGFDECGDKGFAVLDIGDGGCRVSFVPAARRRFHALTLCTDTMPEKDTKAVETAITKMTAELPAADIVKLALTGTDSAENRMDTGYLESRFAQRFFHFELTDERSVRLDAADYQNDISLRGAFVRQVLSSVLSDAEKQEILRLGLAVLSGEDDTAGGDMP